MFTITIVNYSSIKLKEIQNKKAPLTHPTLSQTSKKDWSQTCEHPEKEANYFTPLHLHYLAHINQQAIETSHDWTRPLSQGMPWFLQGGLESEQEKSLPL